MIRYFDDHKNTLTVVVSIIIFLIVLVSTGLLYPFNKGLQDFYYNLKNEFSSSQASKNIIVLELDEKSLNKLGGFPLKRDIYAQVVDNLSAAGVSVIGFDLFFSDDKNTERDMIFADSIQKAGNVVFGLPILTTGVPEQPTESFNVGLLGKGYVRPNIDKQTKIAYSITPFHRFEDNKVYDHFTLAILKSYYAYLYNESVSEYLNLGDAYSLKIGSHISAPYSHPGKKELLINYIDPQKFRQESLYNVYNNDFTHEEFKDNIVLIGVTAKGLNDTVVSPMGEIYGVYVHANVLNTFLKKNFLQYFNKNLEYILLFLLIIISVYFNFSRSGWILITSNLFIGGIFLLLFPLLVIIYTNLIINFPLELFFAMLLSLSSANIIKYMTELKHKNKLNKALAEYVSEDIAKEVLSGEGNVNLEGEQKKITIFFSDIEGFTQISEKKKAHDLVEYLRDYLSIMSHVILDYYGFINKYEGDGIMALWGVFGKTEGSVYNACMTALKQREVLKNFNEKWRKKGFSKTSIRIGIHYGEVIIGNIGAQGRKMEFTAIGDNVNVASRLEGVNKYYFSEICVSKEIYVQQKSRFFFRRLGKIILKGKQKPTVIYELINLNEQMDDTQRNIYKDYEQALDLFYKQKFREAKDIFSECDLLGDMVSKKYVGLCDHYIKNIPGGNWNGTEKMKGK